MSSLLDYLEQFAQWLLDLLLWLPLKVWEILMTLGATIMESIPVPAWLASGDPFSFLPGYVTYFLAAFEVPEGLTIIFGAFLIRFLIRRIPFIG